MGGAFSDAKNNVVEEATNKLSTYCTTKQTDSDQRVKCSLNLVGCDNADISCGNSDDATFICSESDVASAAASAVQGLSNNTTGGLGIEISKTTNNVTETVTNSITQSCGQQFAAPDIVKQYSEVKLTCKDSNHLVFDVLNKLSQYSNCALTSSVNAQANAQQTLAATTKGYDPLASIGLMAGAMFAVVIVIVVVVVLVVLMPKGGRGGGGSTVVIQQPPQTAQSRAPVLRALPPSAAPRPPVLRALPPAAAP